MSRPKAKANHPPWIPQIIPQDAVGGFLVESEGDPGTYYICDLMAYDGSGACECDDFTMRIECWRSREIDPVHKSCKHIRRAFAFVGQELIRKMVAMAKAGELKIDHSRMRRVGE